MNDTICALATQPGGALGIIRVSGTDAFHIVDQITSRHITEAIGNTLVHTHIKENENIIDDVVLSFFRAPHSYTGEDSIEISCHGSRYILYRILELLTQHGCRQAFPGEFTQRAYLNGKLDLSQAEAVADLIASTNRATHQMAISQLRGDFSNELSLLRNQLLKLTSLLELELDFSDHEDLEFADRNELLKLAQKIDSQTTRLAHSFKAGNVLKQGIPVAIVGKTNVGKSTLLNRLLKEERAIVSDIHGTTRDIIEDTIDLQGVTFRFIDTAGIRHTTDTIEQIGISRTYIAIKKAHIILWVIDELPTPQEVQEIQNHLEDKSLIIIRNKTDKKDKLWNQEKSSLLQSLSAPLLQISARYDTNLAELESAIYQAADLPTLSDTDIIINNARHHEALVRAHEHLIRVIDGLKTHQSGDLLAEDLRLTLDQLAEITGGTITPHEILENIFRTFCIGK